MNCADVCPKGLNPSKAISSIKKLQITKKKSNLIKSKRIFSIKSKPNEH